VSLAVLNDKTRYQALVGNYNYTTTHAICRYNRPVSREAYALKSRYFSFHMTRSPRLVNSIGDVLAMMPSGV
jgi:hypothetical protein